MLRAVSEMIRLPFLPTAFSFYAKGRKAQSLLPHGNPLCSKASKLCRALPMEQEVRERLLEDLFPVPLVSPNVRPVDMFTSALLGRVH
jgi:hypothetical protein